MREDIVITARDLILSSLSFILIIRMMRFMMTAWWWNISLRFLHYHEKTQMVCLRLAWKWVKYEQGIAAWELVYSYKGWENLLFDQSGDFMKQNTDFSKWKKKATHRHFITNLNQRQLIKKKNATIWEYSMISSFTWKM